MGCGNVVKVAKNKENVLEDVSVNYLGCGVYVKQVELKKDWVVSSHKHKYDHLAILQYGSVELTVDGIARVLSGPTSIEIAAGKVHTVKALSDALWLCVHQLEDTSHKAYEELYERIDAGKSADEIRKGVYAEMNACLVEEEEC